MIAIPALDLREGACVQLVGGEYGAESVRLNDPLRVLREWERCGFGRVHIVDLDAATSRGSNAPVITNLLRATTLELQVGGGVRSDQNVRALLDDGARYVVLGTRALEEPNWLEQIARDHAGNVIVAVDVRDDVVLCRGWQQAVARDAIDIINDLNAVPLGGILVTAVHAEGQMRGPDLALAERVTAASNWPVLVAGGIASLSDLTALAERGVAGAVIGMALYTGALDPRTLVEEFAA